MEEGCTDQTCGGALTGPIRLAWKSQPLKIALPNPKPPGEAN